MQYLILSGDDTQEGIFRSIIQETRKGAEDGGAETQILPLEGIGPCRSCSEDESECKSGRRCAYGEDGFDEAQAAVRQADALCLVAPLKWGDVDGPTKDFMERLRRCEHGLNGSLAGKPILIVAVADGSVNALLACLEQMDRFCRQTGAVIFDYLCINRWNSDYQKVSAHAAAKSMAYGRKAGY